MKGYPSTLSSANSPVLSMPHDIPESQFYAVQDVLLQQNSDKLQEQQRIGKASREIIQKYTAKKESAIGKEKMNQLDDLKRELRLKRSQLELSLRGSGQEKVRSELKLFDNHVEHQFKVLQSQLKIDVDRFITLNKLAQDQIVKLWSPPTSTRTSSIALAEGSTTPFQLFQHQNESIPKSEGGRWYTYVPPYDHTEEFILHSRSDGFQTTQSMNSSTGGQLRGQITADNHDASDFDSMLIVHAPTVGFWHRVDAFGPVSLAFGARLNSFFSSTRHRDEFGFSQVNTHHGVGLYAEVTNGILSNSQDESVFQEFSTNVDGRWTHTGISGIPTGRMMAFNFQFNEPYVADSYIFIRIGLSQFLASFSNDCEVASVLNSAWQIGAVSVQTRIMN